MSMNLFAASRQWAERPADERFETIADLYRATKQYADTAQEVEKDWADLRTENQGGDLVLVGKGANPAKLTNWAFGQICRKIGAPASYLGELPGTLAMQNVNHGLAHLDSPGTANVLFHANGSLLVRCITSDKYSRIWNYEVAQRLMGLGENGWRVPPARPVNSDQPGARRATDQDVLNDQGFGLSVKVGDFIAPAGIYASDHDMFVFMVNETAQIDDGSGQPMSRGFFVSNSEVGAASLRLTRFLYRHVCGNHIVWDAKNVTEIKLVHTGDIQAKAARELYAEIKRYSNESVSDENAKIASARQFVLGDNKDKVLDTLFGMRSLGITRRSLSAAYDSTVEHTEDGEPNTAWGMAQGLTRVSQAQPFAEDRTAMDRAAGRVLALAF